MGNVEDAVIEPDFTLFWIEYGVRVSAGLLDKTREGGDSN